MMTTKPLSIQLNATQNGVQHTAFEINLDRNEHAALISQRTVKKKHHSTSMQLITKPGSDDHKLTVEEVTQARVKATLTPTTE